ncbi:uncharacterized protein [Eurosta solidaginis]|uniref:uncharacterized protein n=1 Tax=Eurosta solidaginis TaxID=178769 RepID=UPI0035314D9C
MKDIFAFLMIATVLLLLKYSACLPKPENDEVTNMSLQEPATPHTMTTTTTPTSEESTESTQSNGRKRFVAIVYKTYSDLLNFQLQRTNQIAKDVLADSAMSSIGSRAMENERTVLEKYVKNSKDALIAVIPAKQNDQQNRFFFVVGKDFLLEDFNSFTRKRGSTKELLTPEKQISWDILKKHGYFEYVSDLENRTKEFTSALVDEFENYIKSFRPIEQEREKGLVNLWAMYAKNELGVNKAEFGKHLFSVFFQYEPKY